MRKFIFGDDKEDAPESEEEMNTSNPLPNLGELFTSSIDGTPEDFGDPKGTAGSPLVSLMGIGRLTLPSIPSISTGTPSAADLNEPPTSKEYRRIFSEVIPGELFVSGWLVAEDWAQLDSHGITHVINTACTVSKCPFQGEISYLALSINDNRNEDIIAFVYPCIEFIEAAISSGGRVLVHCMEGVSRSCSIAIAYVMWKRGMSYVEAQAFVQAARPVCQPNPSFICQLLEFEKRLNNTCDPGRVLRVTLRRYMDQFALIATTSKGKPVDRRFPYIFQEDSQRLRICYDASSPHSDFLIQLGRDAVDRLARIEGFEPQVEIVHFEDDLIPVTATAFDGDFAACWDFLQAMGQQGSKEPSEEEPCTARSHKSHGSIDSARGNNKVRVFQLQQGMEELDSSIPYFDADDLDSRFVYLFLANKLYIAWVGDEVSDWAEAEIVADIQRLLKLPSADVRLVKQGAEPEEFWELFLRTEG
jgi:hypothetical protein